MLPFGREYVALCALQAVTVLLPRAPLTLPALRRRRVLGLLPLAGIGGVVLAIGADPRLAAKAVDLSAVATPFLALAGLVSLRVRLLALAAVPAFVVAWRGSGRLADVGIDVLIALGCATLAWLTGAVAPRLALAFGIVAAAVVDVYQVLVTEQVQVVARALHAAAPPRGLPPLQEAVYAGASMGYGDLYVAALLGVVLAASTRRLRLAAAAAVLVLGVAEGLLFRVLDTLPATVPVALALLGALAVERRAGPAPAARETECSSAPARYAAPSDERRARRLREALRLAGMTGSRHALRRHETHGNDGIDP
jgi:hypothetical protein